jgi:hypothetical protein
LFAGWAVYLVLLWAALTAYRLPQPVVQGSISKAALMAVWVEMVRGRLGPKLWPAASLLCEYGMHIMDILKLDSKASERVYKNVQAAAARGEVEAGKAILGDPVSTHASQ